MDEAVAATTIGSNGVYWLLTFLLWTGSVVVNPIAYSNNRLTDGPFITTIVLSGVAWLLALVVAGILTGLLSRVFSVFGKGSAEKKGAEIASIPDIVYSVVNLLFSVALVIYLPISYDVNNNMADWIFIVDICIAGVIFLASVLYMVFMAIWASIGVNTSEDVVRGNISHHNKRTNV